MSVKQVIIIRKQFPDGKGGVKSMRRGKEISQGAHASMAFMLKQVRAQDKKKNTVNMTPEGLEWMRTGQTKVCLKINTEEELLEVTKKAKAAGLEVHVITDAGRTEFGGQPTVTCAAIGPNKSEHIDKFCKHLKLY